MIFAPENELPFSVFQAMLFMVAIQKLLLNAKLISGSSLKNLLSIIVLVLNIYMINTPMSNSTSLVWSYHNRQISP